MSKLIIVFFFPVLYLLVLTGCVSSTDPHENFLDFNRDFVGQNFDQLMIHHYSFRDRTWEAATLSNGNIQYKSKYINKLSCMKIYEVDKLTRTIIRFDWSGEKKHCIINP